jgi:hypothetical protein
MYDVRWKLACTAVSQWTFQDMSHAAVESLLNFYSTRALSLRYPVGSMAITVERERELASQSFRMMRPDCRWLVPGGVRLCTTLADIQTYQGTCRV